MAAKAAEEYPVPGHLSDALTDWLLLWDHSLCCPAMWFVYSLSAAILWGLNYAASGRVLKRGVAPSTLFALDLLFALAAVGGGLLLLGRGKAATLEVRQLGTDWIWLATAMVCSTAGGLLVFLAIDAKNATLASLIEISYPLFVALFAWILFREVQVNWPTALGGCLVLGGVALVYWGNRH